MGTHYPYQELILPTVKRPSDWPVYGNRGYKFLRGAGMTFVEAARNCSQMGGRVAVLSNVNDKAAIATVSEYSTPKKITVNY